MDVAGGADEFGNQTFSEMTSANGISPCLQANHMIEAMPRVSYMHAY